MNYFWQSYQRLSSISWENLNPIVNDQSPLKPQYLAGGVYWSVICSAYFPKYLLFSPTLPLLPQVPLVLKLPFKPATTLSTLHITAYWKKSFDQHDDEQFALLRSYADKLAQSECASRASPTVDALIDNMNKDLESVETEIGGAYRRLQHNYAALLEGERFFLSQEYEDDIMMDVFIITDIEREYLRILEETRISNKPAQVVSKKSRNIFLDQKPRNTKVITNDSYVCQICNGSDTTESDSIVFCSRCSITVHQRCYRLNEVPSQDWICNLCLEFKDKGRYLRCPMCTRRGGAMVKSNCLVWSEHLRGVNPSMYCTKKRAAVLSKARVAQEAQGNISHSNRRLTTENTSRNTLVLDKSFGKELYDDFDKKLYYNYFKEPAEYSGRFYS